MDVFVPRPRNGTGHHPIINVLSRVHAHTHTREMDVRAFQASVFRFDLINMKDGAFRGRSSDRSSACLGGCLAIVGSKPVPCNARRTPMHNDLD